ncbi:MAG: hypothetical protein JO306_16635, partial [Gemmatimonadetes bacterium]|nr:hypothetical protein [Gemmatimonadota bacterium]
MSHTTADAPIAEPIPVPEMQIAPPAPLPPSTLGQTPHEPSVRPWELELLISGALVFAILQIPGELDTWIHGIEPKLDGGGMLVAFIIWYYLKLATYALAAGFAVHLLVRGYWVGAIGLEAVFPEGIRWDKTRAGPILREVQRSRTPPMQRLIDGADRVASMIFGGAFALALMLMFSLLVGGSIMLAAFGIARMFLPLTTALWVMVLGAMVYALPMMLATLVDRRMGDRLPPDSRRARVIRGVGVTYMRLQAIVPFAPLMSTLVTNLREKRGFRVGAMVLVVGSVVLVQRDLLMEAGGIHHDSYSFLPDEPGALGVATAFYDDRRGDDPDYAESPFIQSDMVRDPYVRLFIPYRPKRHNDLVAEKCPAVRAAVPRGGLLSASRPQGDVAGRAVLACLARLQPAPAGTIFFAGADVAELSLAETRRRIAFVPQ